MCRRNPKHFGADRQAYRNVRPVDSGAGVVPQTDAGYGERKRVWAGEGFGLGGLGKRIVGTWSLQCSVIQHIVLYYRGRIIEAYHEGLIMSSLKTISFRIPSDTVESLDELAESMDRDRSHVLNEAVEHYLRLNEHHIKLIKKGLRAAERGDFVPDAEMKKLIARMRRAK